MADGELQRLAVFSDTIRNSTVKRLKQVPSGYAGWAIRPGAMSFSDIAHHLIQCDRALFKALETRTIGKNLGSTGQAGIADQDNFDALIEELKALRESRNVFVQALMPADLDVMIDAERIRGVERIPFGILLLETLDHEAHHRGQLAVYLATVESAQALSA